MLKKLKDFYPNYKDTPSGQGFDLDEIKNFSVYAQEDKVGSIDDVLVDIEDGRFRYYIVDTGFWIFGKKILLPVGLGRINADEKKIYVNNLTKEQVEDLPNFDDLEKVDFDQEEQIRGIYRSGSIARDRETHDRNSYQYDHDPDLYNLSEQEHQSLKLYEERLIADKQRQKVGEVQIGKRVETETVRASVPVEKEKVVIERTAPTGSPAIDPDRTAFQDGEVARVEVYEETPDIHKEAFVREEVRVRKEVDRDLVNAEEQIRREELDVDTQGRPVVNKQI
jgi:uncharacterized protein (TIGR02271 family)